MQQHDFGFKLAGEEFHMPGRSATAVGEVNREKYLSELRVQMVRHSRVHECYQNARRIMSLISDHLGRESAISGSWCIAMAQAAGAPQVLCAAGAGREASRCAHLLPQPVNPLRQVVSGGRAHCKDGQIGTCFSDRGECVFVDARAG